MRIYNTINIDIYVEWNWYCNIYNLLMVHGDIKHAKGGGIYYTTYLISLSRNWHSPESRLFKAGLKQDPKFVINTLHGAVNKPSDLHDKLDYERVNNV